MIHSVCGANLNKIWKIWRSNLLKNLLTKWSILLFFVGYQWRSLILIKVVKMTDEIPLIVGSSKVFHKSQNTLWQVAPYSEEGISEGYGSHCDQVNEGWGNLLSKLITSMTSHYRLLLMSNEGILVVPRCLNYISSCGLIEEKSV